MVILNLFQKHTHKFLAPNLSKANTCREGKFFHALNDVDTTKDQQEAIDILGNVGEVADIRVLISYLIFLKKP